MAAFILGLLTGFLVIGPAIRLGLRRQAPVPGVQRRGGTIGRPRPERAETTEQRNERVARLLRTRHVEPTVTVEATITDLPRREK